MSDESLIFTLFSRQPLNPARARTQLALLVRTFGPGKHAGRPLAGDDLDEASRVFAHRGSECHVQWGRRVRAELRERRFARMCTEWTLWIEPAALRKGGVELLHDLAVEATAVAAAEVLFVTPWLDYKAKNQSVTPLPGGGTREVFVGDDPDHGLPGLYWLNVLGARYVEWLGRDRFDFGDGAIVEDLPGGSVLVQFGRTPDEAPTMHARQRAAIQQLGDDAFFDLARPERTLRQPP
jgi:hypothetical protein